MADSKKDIGETTHSSEFRDDGESSSSKYSKFKSDSKSVSVSVSVSVSDSDDDPIPAYKKKKLQKSTANSSSVAAATIAADMFRDNETFMSDYNIKKAIIRTNRVISSANNLPDKGVKLKNYVNSLEQTLKGRIIRRSLQDARGSKRLASSVAASVIDTKSLIRVCPSGFYDKDQAWDEKGHMDISHIFVYSESGYISGLQFQYVEGGKLVLSQTYGQNAGLNFKLVTFQDISEYIIGVTGTFGSFGIGKTRAVKSLTIETNRRLYELNGRPENGETKFSYQFGPTNQFGGFHGTFSRGPSAMLTSIGVYINTAIDLDVFLSPSA